MVSIKDIAKAVGVSPSTVSYVLSNKRSISSEVRQRVLEHIDALGYKPHAVARNLAIRKTHTIGFYCTNKTSQIDYSFVVLLRGIMAAVKLNGYKVLLIDVIEEDKDYSIPVDDSFPIDGAIVTRTRNSEAYLKELEKEKMPFVLVGKAPKSAPIHYVDNDNQQAAYKSTEFYIQQEKKRIGLIIGATEDSTLYTDYISGYVNALSNYNLLFNHDYIIQITNDSDLKKTMDIIRSLEIEAVVLHADLSHSAKFINIVENSLSGLQVTAFGLDLLAEYISPLQSNIRIIKANFYELGFDAGSAIVQLIENNGNELIHRLHPPTFQ